MTLRFVLAFLFLVYCPSARRICHYHGRFGHEHGRTRVLVGAISQRVYPYPSYRYFLYSNVCSTSHNPSACTRRQASVYILPSSHVLPLSSNCSYSVKVPAFRTFHMSFTLGHGDVRARNSDF